MVLGQDDNVLWFSSTTAIAVATATSVSSFSTSSSSLDNSTLLVINETQASVTTKVEPTLTATQHWSIVYGPMFEPFLPGSQRRRRPNQPIISLTPSATRQDHVLRQQQQQQLGDPNDNDPSFFLQENNSCSQSMTSAYEMYYEDMPLELLGNIFSNFMQISAESLTRLAEERTVARSRARRPAHSAASTAANSTPPQLRLRLQEQQCNGYAQQIQRLRSRLAQDSSETTMHFTVDDDDTESQVGSDGELEISAVSSLESEDSIADNINSNRSSSSGDESQDIGMIFQNDSNSTLSSYATSEEDDKSIRDEIRGFAKSYDSFAECECSCRPTLRETTDHYPRPRLGINRVDNDMDEAAMLYHIHRDQYFHPTTHTSLRSDLYRCSLVNRQWRLAALQLLWQSVVLDSESCRPEHITRSCRRHNVSSKIDTEAAQSPMVKTRLEAMLDSYLQIYGLDMAKCVQTVELDLRLLVWSADGEAIRRILCRLSPFTHLRLIWAEKESAEEMATGFRTAIQGLQGQIRHLHFSPGFILSKAWIHEMATMERLEHLTLERLGALETMNYDWSRIRHLTLHAAIPMHLFHHLSSTVPTALSTSILHTSVVGESDSGHPQLSDVAAGSALVGQLLPFTTNSLSLNSVSQDINQPPASHSHPTVHLQKSPIGWWQWANLTVLEVVIKGSVLPRQWLLDLAEAIAEQSGLVGKLLSIQHQSSGGSVVWTPKIPKATIDGRVLSFGPPLRVLRLDCQISHPHKDIFVDLIQSWGQYLEEFHVHYSGELTDDFFCLCLRKMTRLKRLSLRDSKGITGEGVFYPGTESTCADAGDGTARAAAGSSSSSSTALVMCMQTASVSLAISAAPNTTSAETPILWPHDFCELRLDQSRVRREFLQTLKERCPGVRYSVREVRWG